MMKYVVNGKVTVSVIKTVEADSPEEAIEKAYEEFEGVTDYGFDGTQIGVQGEGEMIQADGEVDFTSAERM
jgi:hypothetical protein